MKELEREGHKLRKDRYLRCLCSINTVSLSMKMILKGQQTDWDLFLGCLAGAYRLSTHQSTGLTPNMLMLGKEIRLPTEIVFGSLDNTGETISSYGSYVEVMRERMHRAHGIAQKHLASSAKRQKESYDLREKTLSFKAGDIVWYLNETKVSKHILGTLCHFGKIK